MTAASSPPPMRLSAPRLALLTAAALLAAAGCAHRTEEDRQVASVYLENAAQYYDAGHYLRAFQQWGRVLELEPDDEKALLGQGMALYQLGREESKQGVEWLASAEQRLDDLRGGRLGKNTWKAELGYGLVQLRWADLYGRKLARIASDAKAGKSTDPKEEETCGTELPQRIAAAEESLQAVLEDEGTEPNFLLTCWLGLAKAATQRGDWASTLTWARKYGEKVSESKQFWTKQGEEYATRLLGVELQEAELRDAVANCLFKLGRLDDAEKELDELIAAQPERADAYLNRAQIRHARSAWDLARSDLRAFLGKTQRPQNDASFVEAERLLSETEARLAEEDERLGRGPGE